MKIHTPQFKEKIKEFGRQLDSKIIYELNGEQIELGPEQLNSITPTYQADILKSVMKELDIDSNVDIPLETILRCQFGVLTENGYEYIDFGNYIVYSSEKQEDTGSYKIICYDMMLRSMTEYHKLNTKEFPMTVKEYITTLCNEISLNFSSNNFVNQDRIIASDIYEGQGYTYRDIFDELAQVTASTICIDNNDNVEIRYINETNDTINEEYLKDINVNFGEKYGPVNSIVLSRAAESDNVYLQDEVSVELNGLHELKIVDNQIMNYNDRSDYLPEILSKLDGLEYYINDFSSTGICYYDVCDKYNIQIGDNTYSCIMLNDEINITQGLEENIHADMPQESETDYTKADKTDRRINQTYFIVDKQNQQIESAISQVTEQNDKISKITQTVDELNSKISDVADITTSSETSYGILNFSKINKSEPILIKIRPILENISYLYPRNNLYPNNSLYPKNRLLRFTNTETNETFEYLLPDDLLFYNSNVYDEFVLSYDNQICNVIKRCGYDAEGNVIRLNEEIIETFEYPTIQLTDGDYEVSLLGYDTAYMYVTLMAQNIYTTQFATKVEVKSEIKQTADEINLEVSKKVDDKDVVSTINQSAEQITLTSNRLVVDSTNFKLDKNGNMTCNNANMYGVNIREGNIELRGEKTTAFFSALDREGANQLSISPSMLYQYNQGNEIFSLSASGTGPYGTTNISGRLELYGKRSSISIFNDILYTSLTAPIYLDGSNGNIKCVSLSQTSLEEEKKNIKRLNNAKDILNNTSIYKYNFKFENDDDKKHIGFVIGDNFNYSKEITSANNDGVDIYSMVSVLWQVVKEQQEEINELKEMIKNGKN